MPDFAAVCAALAKADGLLRSIYIAGPMSGIEGWNHAAFGATAAVLREDPRGWHVFSPAELFEGDAERPRAHYMRAGLDRLVGASSAQPWRPAPTDVVLLPGWESSRGAVLEVQVAQELGLRVWRPSGQLLPELRWEALSVLSFGEYAGLAGQVLMWPAAQEFAHSVKCCGGSLRISTAPRTARDVRYLPVEGDGDSTVHVTPPPQRPPQADPTGLAEVVASMPSLGASPRMASLPSGVGECDTPPVVRINATAARRSRREELARLAREVQACGRRLEAAALLDEMPGVQAAGEGLDELAALIISESHPLEEGCR